MPYSSDIPLSMAVQAHAGTSFSPEQRGASEVASYVAKLVQVRELLERSGQRGGTVDLVEEEFSRFRAGYSARYRAYLSSRGRCISAMITGPSNFPARRNQKRFAVVDRRVNDMEEFQARAISAAIKRLRPELRPIMAGDADAIERLEAKIRAAEADQARMKLINQVIRKNLKKPAEQKMLALVEAGFSDAAAKLILTPDCFNSIGVPQYRLSNNNANIRRMKQRVEQISRAQSIPEAQIEGNGIVMNDCPAENRVRLTFPGKPAVEVRDSLKSRGFRWAPSLGVWQAYRNSGSLALAAKMVGKEGVK